MPKIELRVASGAQAGTLIPVPIGRFIVGRETDCHLRPNSELISRHHCAFTSDEYGLRVRDLGSTNGTFLNGQRVQGTLALKAGDLVSVGKVELVVVIDGLPAIDAGETIQGQHGDTLFTSKPGNQSPVGDAGMNIAEMSDALSALEDEATVAAAPPAQDTAVAAVVASPATTDTMEFAMADPALVAAAQQQQQFAYNPWGGMPQYGYPPQFAPMPYGYGYPPQAMPAGYPAMPPGYPAMPPGYGYPPPQQPVPEAAPAPSARVSSMPETRLPDPSETGAKPPEPRPAAPTDASGKSKAHIPTAAQDIINSYLNRRPKTE
jgi:hypothetical protein